MRVTGFRHARHRFFGKTALHEVPAVRAMEIDTPEDLRIARALAPMIDPSLQIPPFPDPLHAVIFDFDGVFTDNRVWQSEDGRESVACSRSGRPPREARSRRSVTG